ncbi:alpha/beta hydrolase family protein [Microlunatus sp. Y2014]|uniref:alpha/beta hydrolase family protein n=1 Tax=Microlunatus sp. Y2014 TaxID=3418488 RepID=UPI003DA6E4C3
MTDRTIRLAPHTDDENPLSTSLFDLDASDSPPPILPDGEDWTERRGVIEGVWRDYIGRLDEPGSGEITVREKTQGPDETFERWLVHLDGGAIGLVPAEILVPQGISEPRAAVIACHSTKPDGKTSVTHHGEGSRPYGVELAERGYVVIAPDCLTAGERIYPGLKSYHTAPFYQDHPDSSMMARNLTDHMTAVNTLGSLPFVDDQRIGVIGHSLGGYNAFFLGGLDDRVKAVVNSCGFSPLRRNAKALQWGERDWYTHLPRLTEEFARLRVPFDFNQIVALVAPTPIFNYFGQVDRIFPNWAPIAEGLQSVRELYVHLGHEDRFTMLMGGGSHDFPTEIRQLSYDFLDRWLAGPLS